MALSFMMKSHRKKRDNNITLLDFGAKLMIIASIQFESTGARVTSCFTFSELEREREGEGEGEG